MNSVTRPRLLAVLLGQDSFFTEAAVKRDYVSTFGAIDAADFHRAITSLSGNDTLIGFDLENDGLDGVLIEHEKYGKLDNADLFLIGDENYFALGPAFPIALQNDLDAVAEAATDGGLKEPLRLLSLLPIDSERWTGLSTQLRFTPEVQAKAVAILNKAQASLNNVGLTNADARRAGAYIDCVLMLASLPEPEPDLIHLLLKRLLTVVGFMGLFADLKTLFGGSF